MGMGYGSNFADVVDQDQLAKLAKKQWNKLVKIGGDNLDDLLDSFANNDEELPPEGFDDAVNAFILAIEEKTGMQITLCYHDSDNHGDRYDDVNGHFWAVENAYVPNPAITTQDKIGRVYFVTYG